MFADRDSPEIFFGRYCSPLYSWVALAARFSRFSFHAWEKGQWSACHLHLGSEGHAARMRGAYGCRRLIIDHEDGASYRVAYWAQYEHDGDDRAAQQLADAQQRNRRYMAVLQTAPIASARAQRAESPLHVYNRWHQWVQARHARGAAGPRARLDLNVE